jgi:cysteine desulfurase/selenocysteine lyase
MYSLLTDFRAGDNVVTTMMEHNSNYVPWYAMCRDILAKLGRTVDYRIARFDPDTGELDYAHLASLIDSRTKLVCVTGASNFLGTKNRLAYVRELASSSGYVQPNEQRGSYLLVDAAQLVPSTFVASSSQSISVVLLSSCSRRSDRRAVRKAAPAQSIRPSTAATWCVRWRHAEACGLQSCREFAAGT